MDERATKKVVIDPGHGGNDPGTIANDITEKDYTLKISKYMMDRFKELGVPVSITREEDITLDPTDRVKKIQSFYGNGNDVVVVSNHINAGGGDGAEVIYALRNSNGLSSKIANELENTGQNVRKYYQRRLPSNPAKDYYYVLRDTANNESIIVEYGFADSTGDDVNQIKNDWKILAEAVVKAITEYVGSTYRPPTETNYYIVKSGDTLWSIAKKYGISLEELKKENNLTSNTLSIGQYLKIPAANVITEEVEYYIVKSGDTLWSIAKNNDLTVDELKKLNNLTTNTLSIGQKLILKKEQTPTEEIYIVKKGDTLYKIATSHNITVDELKAKNNLTSNTLSIGQQLIIPNVKGTTKYTVKKGDTLYQIAKTYDTTVDKIKALNNLTSNTLSINQVLLIPNN